MIWYWQNLSYGRELHSSRGRREMGAELDLHREKCEALRARASTPQVGPATILVASERARSEHNGITTRFTGTWRSVNSSPRRALPLIPVELHERTWCCSASPRDPVRPGSVAHSFLSPFLTSAFLHDSQVLPTLFPYPLAMLLEGSTNSSHAF